jgi:poly-gamma-glutamate capsule biosynthesis protein CapA/YwtB (metallophosphatase superfamily)
MASGEALLVAVGDIGPDRPDPRNCFDLARSAIQAGDLAFCQLEVNLTSRGARLPQARHTTRSGPESAVAMREAGFTHVSFAGNHCMDWGRDGFFDTIEALKAAKLQVMGVGANIGEARRPVITEVKGVRVAFLAYCSILPAGYWAEEDRAGCAPMRAFTLYEQIETDQPGTPARIHTFAHREDLDALTRDISAARALADVVVVSLHWGIHFIPAVLADYQRQVAHAAIDAGADLILGHHAHILKGVEVYKGRAIFYSLGNFAIDLRMTPAHAAGKGFREIQQLSPGWTPDFDSLYNFPPDSRMTMVVRAALTKKGVREVGFVPAFINRDAQPEVLAAEDPRYDQVADYVAWASREQGLTVGFEKAAGEIRIDLGQPGPSPA